MTTNDEIDTKNKKERVEVLANENAKNKTVEPAVLSNEEFPPNKDKPKKASGGGCGAKDLQNTDGKENACVLASGHEGDHSTGKVEDGGYGFSEYAAKTPLPADVAAKIKARDEAAAKAARR